MNRKMLLAAGSLAVLSVVLLLAVVGLRNVFVIYVCQVDFLFECGKPFAASTSEDSTGYTVDEHNRLACYEMLVSDFKREWHSFPMSEKMLRCKQDSILRMEPESRTQDIFSSMQLDVIGMPSTNFVYPCRLLLSDVSRRNLGEYARICMGIVKDKIDEDNRIALYKCTFREHQAMRRAERRIKDIEKLSEKAGMESAMDEELSQARQTVRDMEKVIEQVRERVMSKREKRITQESPPDISWHIQFGTAKDNPWNSHCP